jgi:hypothetical protein
MAKEMLRDPKGTSPTRGWRFITKKDLESLPGAPKDLIGKEIKKGFVLSRCEGEAHDNSFIDNCMICCPYWLFYPKKES